MAIRKKKTESARRRKVKRPKKPDLTGLRGEARRHAELLGIARDRFADAEEAEADQRERELEDLAFAAGDQWPDDIRKARRGMDANGGLPAVPARPCLTINGTLEPCNQIVADAQDSELGFELVPADDFGELVGPIDDTEIQLREGLVRRIQRETEALDARIWGLDRGSKCGRGYWGVMTRYASGKTNDQEIYVEKFYNQACVTLDPSHESITGSDAEWGFVGRDVPWDEYEAEYGEVNGKANTVCSASNDEFRALGDDYPGWFTTEGETRTCRVVNYYYIDRTTRTLAILSDGSVEWQNELPEGTEAVSTRTVIDRQVKWAKIDGAQVIDETDWPSPYIPIIKYIGRELQPYDEQRRCEGIVRPAIDPGRAKNYMVSKWVEMIGLAPIPPLMMAGGQDEFYEEEYKVMNTRTLGVLHYNQTDTLGRPAPPPFKTPSDIQIAPVAQSIAMFDQAIQSATESHDTTHGKADPALRSGRAIEAVAANDRHGSSNYMAHWARSIEHEGRIINSLLYPIYGTRPGRITRIVDPNGNQETLMLGQPFTMQGNGKMQRPVHAPDDPTAKKFELTKDAKFNVVVKVTKNYETRRQEEAAILGQIISAEPQAMMAVYGDLFFKNQDGPGHEEMAERAKIMLAPQIQQALAAKAQGQDIPPHVQAQLTQMQQKIQEQQGIIQQAQHVIQTDQVKHEAMLQKAKMEGDNAIQLAHINNAAKIEAARISAKKPDDTGAEAQEELLATGIQHAQENFTAEQDRQHEIDQTVLEHQLEMQRAAQEHQQTMEQGAQQANNQAALAEQGQAHALQQGQQQADLAPEPRQGE